MSIIVLPHHTDQYDVIACDYFLPLFSTAKGLFFQDYEGVKEGNDFGTRKTSTRPNCGRKSLKIDVSSRYLYREGHTKNRVVVKRYSPKIYKKVRDYCCLLLESAIEKNFRCLLFLLR